MPVHYQLVFPIELVIDQQKDLTPLDYQYLKRVNNYQILITVIAKFVIYPM
jgi:hypothetical protein